MQKTNQEIFRIENAIKRKGNKQYVKWKGYDCSLNSCIDKKDVEWNTWWHDYIGYITMKDSDYIKTYNVNSLYLIIGEVDGYIEKIKMEINTQFLILQIKTKKYC